MGPDLEVLIWDLSQEMNIPEKEIVLIYQQTEQHHDQPWYVGAGMVDPRHNLVVSHREHARGISPEAAITNLKWKLQFRKP
ncbi:hypothetical protein [Palleronia sp.]|uniref:hypothetical protein n=1 Tax=Palleronia sp. TaxID=1940284 RepID=UPI0035C82CA4